MFSGGLTEVECSAGERCGIVCWGISPILDCRARTTTVIAAMTLLREDNRRLRESFVYRSEL